MENYGQQSIAEHNKERIKKWKEKGEQEGYLPKELGCGHGREKGQPCPHCMGIGIGRDINMCPDCGNVLLRKEKGLYFCPNCKKTNENNF